MHRALHGCHSGWKTGKAGKAGKSGVFQKIAGKAGKGYHFSLISAGKAGILCFVQKMKVRL